VNVRAALTLLALATVAAGCAPDAGSGQAVEVELGDFTLTLDATTVRAGTVDFLVSNRGPSVHEIEVFAGAAEGERLPVHSSVADTTGLDLLDEVEDVLPGTTATLTLDLAPGTYLVICNLPDHYEHGMWQYLTVTDSSP
jgi:uncharacterized cupredoxin-like copper-binding protein